MRLVLLLPLVLVGCVAPRQAVEPSHEPHSAPQQAVSAADLDALWSRLRGAIDALWARGVSLDGLVEVLRDIDELRRRAGGSVDSTLANASAALREVR